MYLKKILFCYSITRIYNNTNMHTLKYKTIFLIMNRYIVYIYITCVLALKCFAATDSLELQTNEIEANYNIIALKDKTNFIELRASADFYDKNSFITTVNLCGKDKILVNEMEMEEEAFLGVSYRKKFTRNNQDDNKYTFSFVRENEMHNSVVFIPEYINFKIVQNIKKGTQIEISWETSEEKTDENIEIVFSNQDSNSKTTYTKIVENLKEGFVVIPSEYTMTKSLGAKKAELLIKQIKNGKMADLLVGKIKAESHTKFDIILND